jgi:hypothetical protein
MKITRPFLVIAGCMFLLSQIFISCKGDDPLSKPGTLAFHIHALVDTTEIENYGDILHLPGGRAITVNMAQLYLSNIKLIKTDGGVVDGPDTIVLFKQGTEEYELGDVPSGNYKSVRFDIGLSNTTNASTPGPSDEVLNQPSMWFGATAQPEGFVFVNFQGTVDTTTLANGLTLIPFIYKIGTNSHRVTITMPDENYSVLPEELTVIHLEADYGQLLDGIQLNKSENLTIATAEANAWDWIANMEVNMAAMFRYEE